MPAGTDPVATAQTVQTLGEVIQSTGVVGLLLFIVILFIRGDLITKTMLNHLLEQNKNGIELLATKLQAGMKDAVHEGIVAAREDINRDLTDQLAQVSRAVMSRPCILEVQDEDSPRRRKTDRPSTDILP